MRVTKLTVGKGKKTKPIENEEQRTYFQLEMEITDQNEVETARTNALQLIEKWLKESTYQTSKTTPSKMEPALDATKLAKLPWISYFKKGEKARSDESGWLFANTEGTEELVKAIQQSEIGVIRIENFEYRLSGNESQFVSRRRLKTHISKTN